MQPWLDLALRRICMVVSSTATKVSGVRLVLLGGFWLLARELRSVWDGFLRMYNREVLVKSGSISLLSLLQEMVRSSLSFMTLNLTLHRLDQKIKQASPLAQNCNRARRQRPRWSRHVLRTPWRFHPPLGDLAPSTTLHNLQLTRPLLIR